MNDIIKNINYYMTRSADRLKDEQSSYIPTIEQDQIECTVNSYIMDGKRYLINQYENLCIRLRYLKFKSNTYRKNEAYNNKNTSMRELVANNIIQPFALFVNGRFIPWDIISISICPNASYLLIDISGLDGKPIEFKDLINIKYAQILTLPDYISYHMSNPMLKAPSHFVGEPTNKQPGLDEDPDINPLDYNILCSFNKKGEFTIDNPWYFLIIDKEPHVCTAYMSTSNRINGIDISSSFTDIIGNPVNLDGIRFTKENVRKRYTSFKCLFINFKR